MTTTDTGRRPDIMLKHIARVLGLVLVAIGLLNTVPSIPGLDAFFQDLSGNPAFAIRKFPYQWLYPLAFVLMMTVVALHHSFWADFRARELGPLKRSWISFWWAPP